MAHGSVHRYVLTLALAVAACGPSGHSNGDGGPGDGGPDSSVQPHTLTGIVVTPTNPLIELDLGQTGAQAFSATGKFRDGVDEDLTSQVTWSVANPAVGTITAATLDIPAFATAAAEVSLITATYDGMDGAAQITVVAYRRTGPQQDFFFILPYVDPAGTATKPLDFSTTIPSLDVFFMMDTTGSMGGEITNLKNALIGTVINGIQTEVPDSQFGVGAFEDFPIDPYGSLHGSDCGYGEAAEDQPFKLRTAITSNNTAVQNGVNSLLNGAWPIGCGNDLHESMMEGLYQVATGDGLSSPAPTNVPSNHTGVGGVGFRAASMPVVVALTDAASHGPGEGGVCSTYGEPAAYTDAGVLAVAHSRAQTKTALGNICARVVGVASVDGSMSADCTGQPDLEDFATATGARVPPAAWDVPARPANCAAGLCCTDINGAGRAPDGNGLCPVVFKVDGNGSGLGAHIVTGIKMLARFATFDVTSERGGGTTDVDGNPLPGAHTTADFIKAVTPTGFTLPPPPPNLPNPTFDATTFHNVTPGTQVAFDVDAFNDFVEQTSDAQIFRATIQVLAGGCTPLDQREVLILVPPNPIAVD